LLFRLFAMLFATVKELPVPDIKKILYLIVW
jgi:hypothetical protein